MLQFYILFTLAYNHLSSVQKQTTALWLSTLGNTTSNHLLSCLVLPQTTRVAYIPCCHCQDHLRPQYRLHPHFTLHSITHLRTTHSLHTISPLQQFTSSFIHTLSFITHVLNLPSISQFTTTIMTLSIHHEHGVLFLFLIFSCLQYSPESCALHNPGCLALLSI
jgi:hypothetical protein